MFFNNNKCKVMHISDKTLNFKYKIRNQKLAKVKHEKNNSVVNCSNPKIIDPYT